MSPKYFSLFCLCVALLAKEVPVRIYSYEVEAQQNQVVAKKRVVVEYKSYHIEADRAEYDKKLQIVKFYGDITILDDAKYSAVSNFAILDLIHDKVLIKSFFFDESGSNTWIGGTSAKANPQKIELKNAFLSSCDVRCSDWKLGFAKGVLDRKKHWIDLYHIQFFARDIPLLYVPYIGFSTLKQRHTGLLRPNLGISQDEGFIYLQPLYIAEQNWWDLEITPQIRTKRGQGVYSAFRFVDSPDSFGKITTGVFYEKKSYQQREKIKNQKHYGLDIFYQHENIFTPKENIYKNDGLYSDIHSYNDVDYYNLQKHKEIEGVDSQITSRLNYVFSFNKHYFGMYMKYFKDNRKTHNANTLQLVPSLQYHKYRTQFFNRHFSYDVDIKLNHFYREEGLNALEYRLNIPVRFTTTFFDDLLGFSISENLFANYADYNFVNKHLNKKWKNNYIYRNQHQISFYSDLFKNYKDFFHILHLDTTFYIPSFEKIRGDQAPFINIGNNAKKVVLSLSEYFYDKTGEEMLYHRLVQPINYNEQDKLDDLENEIGVKFNNGLAFNTDIFYSHNRSILSEAVTTASYKDDLQELFLSHFYKNRVKGERDSHFIRFIGSRNLSKKYKLFATIDYDLKDGASRNWSIGWGMQKKCWSYEISYKEEVLPTLTREGSRSYENNTIYFRLEFYPLGGFSKSIIDTVSERAL
ncbi:LPS-assembly protein [Nitratiruptor sp. YY08-26]|nr:LPS-assembly protein [Nitratiruptor sp. YY08-13]BCD66596.1 LPS-assembly protein [Nitratiruptor sp. YY08-26]